jgi:hypothetical protein
MRVLFKVLAQTTSKPPARLTGDWFRTIRRPELAKAAVEHPLATRATRLSRWFCKSRDRPRNNPASNSCRPTQARNQQRTIQDGSMIQARTRTITS